MRCLEVFAKRSKELQANGQVKMLQSSLCVSQMGSARAVQAIRKLARYSRAAASQALTGLAARCRRNKCRLQQLEYAWHCDRTLQLQRLPAQHWVRAMELLWPSTALPPYWVSKMDVAGDVTLLLELGEAVRGSVLELDFEFVLSAFAAQAASPGAAWRQIRIASVWRLVS